jgi:hypothetical protein
VDGVDGVNALNGRSSTPSTLSTRSTLVHLHPGLDSPDASAHEKERRARRIPCTSSSAHRSPLLN